jgi:MFS family permease
MTYTRVCLNLFLSNLETTIVSTSLVSISNSLHSFSSSSWIVTAYLVTYTGMSNIASGILHSRVSGFLVIIAKLSDIFGRKPFTILVLIIFIAFSLACGLTHDMTSL